jgi:hypothetical protein
VTDDVLPSLVDLLKMAAVLSAWTVFLYEAAKNFIYESVH